MEGGRGREGRTEGGRNRGRDRGREGGTDGGRDRRREGQREGGTEGGRDRGREDGRRDGAREVVQLASMNVGARPQQLLCPGTSSFVSFAGFCYCSLIHQCEQCSAGQFSVQRSDEVSPQSVLVQCGA